MVLNLTSLTPALSAYIVQIALLTMLCLEQEDLLPTPIERPRQVSDDIIADVSPQGHAPWLQDLRSTVTEDVTEGARPLPWITPSLVPEGATLIWNSFGRAKPLKRNKNLSFCPGANIDGIA